MFKRNNPTIPREGAHQQALSAPANFRDVKPNLYIMRWSRLLQDSEMMSKSIIGFSNINTEIPSTSVTAGNISVLDNALGPLRPEVQTPSDSCRRRHVKSPSTTSVLGNTLGPLRPEVQTKRKFIKKSSSKSSGLLRAGGRHRRLCLGFILAVLAIRGQASSDHQLQTYGDAIRAVLANIGQAEPALSDHQLQNVEDALAAVLANILEASSDHQPQNAEDAIRAVLAKIGQALSDQQLQNVKDAINAVLAKIRQASSQRSPEDQLQDQLQDLEDARIYFCGSPGNRTPVQKRSCKAFENALRERRRATYYLTHNDKYDLTPKQIRKRILTSIQLIDPGVELNRFDTLGNIIITKVPEITTTVYDQPCDSLTKQEIPRSEWDPAPSVCNVVVQCKWCSHGNRETAKFCSQCGVEDPAVEEPPEEPAAAEEPAVSEQ